MFHTAYLIGREGTYQNVPQFFDWIRADLNSPQWDLIGSSTAVELPDMAIKPLHWSF
jgi:hypothetical protein